MLCRANQFHFTTFIAAGSATLLLLLLLLLNSSTSLCTVRSSYVNTVTIFPVWMPPRPLPFLVEPPRCFWQTTCLKTSTPRPRRRSKILALIDGLLSSLLTSIISLPYVKCAVECPFSE